MVVPRHAMGHVTEAVTHHVWEHVEELARNLVTVHADSIVLVVVWVLVHRAALAQVCKAFLKEGGGNGHLLLCIVCDDIYGNRI